MKNQTKICFAYYNRVDFNFIAPIMNKLSSYEHINTYNIPGFFYDDYSQMKNNKKTIPSPDSHYFNYSDYLKCKETLLPSLPLEVKNPLLNSLIQRWWKKEDHRYLKNIRDLLYLSLLEKTKEIKPHILIAPEESDTLRGALVSQVAQKLKIPLWVLSPPFYNKIKNIPLPKTFYAEKYFILLKEFAQHLIKNNYPTSKIIVLSQMNEIKLLKNPSQNQPKILFISQGFNSELHWLELISQLKFAKKFDLVFRPHPHLNLSKKVINLNLPILQIPNLKTNSLSQDIQKSDFIITHSSWSIYKAIELGKSVILIHDSLFEHPFRINQLNHSIFICKNNTELKNAIQNQINKHHEGSCAQQKICTFFSTEEITELLVNSMTRHMNY